jgi:hypothetical protein
VPVYVSSNDTGQLKANEIEVGRVTQTYAYSQRGAMHVLSQPAEPGFALTDAWQLIAVDPVRPSGTADLQFQL